MTGREEPGDVYGVFSDELPRGDRPSGKPAGHTAQADVTAIALLPGPQGGLTTVRSTLNRSNAPQAGTPQACGHQGLQPRADRTRTGRTAAPLRGTNSVVFPLTLSPVHSSSAICSGPPDVPYALQHLDRFHLPKAASRDACVPFVTGLRSIGSGRCCPVWGSSYVVGHMHVAPCPGLAVLGHLNAGISQTWKESCFRPISASEFCRGPPEVAEISPTWQTTRGGFLLYPFRSLMHLQGT